MYKVEQARIIDIPELLEIAVQFWNESDTYSQRPINLNKVKTQLQTLILYPSQGCVLLVKDEDNNIWVALWVVFKKSGNLTHLWLLITVYLLELIIEVLKQLICLLKLF